MRATFWHRMKPAEGNDLHPLPPSTPGANTRKPKTTSPRTERVTAALSSANQLAVTRIDQQPKPHYTPGFFSKSATPLANGVFVEAEFGSH